MFTYLVGPIVNKCNALWCPQLTVLYWVVLEMYCNSTEMYCNSTEKYCNSTEMYCNSTEKLLKSTVILQIC